MRKVAYKLALKLSGKHPLGETLGPVSKVPARRASAVPGLHRAGAAAGAALPNGTAGSAGWSPHPLPLLGGLPHAAVPLSTRADGEAGSPQEFSALE